MESKLLAFEAHGILGNVSYRVSLRSPVTIIVGPNGSGKSTFLNIFYLSITRQWSRLVEYNFEKIVIEMSNKKLEIFKTDIINLESYISATSKSLKKYIDPLRSAGELQNFISKKKFSSVDEAKFSNILGIPARELSSFRNYIMRNTPDLFESTSLNLDADIEALNLGRVLYLPTYRRIEKDLQSIFPDIEDRVRDKINQKQFSSRQGDSFHEIISFGMQDIVALIASFTQKLNALSKSKSNEAAQEYIRDMVQGKIKDFSIGRIREIEADVISEFIVRLDDNLMSPSDKEKLQKELSTLRSRRIGKPPKDMQYLGFFVEKMLGVYLDMQEAESPLKMFTEISGRYLSNNKHVEYKNYEFRIIDKNSHNEIALDDLSSGEKQIISVFAYLHLRQDPNNILIIDEPELSLSVPWQKRFIPDIMATGRCGNLFAVTHSPFVFDNEFRSNIVDVSKLRIY